MPCTCKIKYRDNDVILLKYQHGCPEHEDWCYNDSHKRYIRSTDNVLMCECGRRAFVEVVSPSASDNKPSAKCYSIDCPAIWYERCTSTEYNQCSS